MNNSSVFNLIKELNVYSLELSRIIRIKDEQLQSCLFSTFHINYIVPILNKLNLTLYNDVEQLEIFYDNNKLNDYIKTLENIIDKLNIIL